MVLLIAAIAVSADAQPVTKPSQVTAAKVTKKKHTKPKRVAKAKKRRKLKTLKRITVEQQSAQLASVGRVRYDGEMPPGFAWPASDGMMAVEKGCEAELDAAGVEWQHADPLGKIADPIVVPAMVFGGVAFRSKWDKPPFVFDCSSRGCSCGSGRSCARSACAR